MQGTIFSQHQLDAEIHRALIQFWGTRTSQLAASARDQGNRGAVTGGKQMDGFVALTKTLLLQAGVSPESIFTDHALELPGYYRPNKKWDLLVVDHGVLKAAIEFKSQVGPSFGNNFNNRTEEAMGSALDLWTAYREGAFGTQRAPWLGYFLVLEDCPRSAAPVSARSPHFPVRDEFLQASYQKRYELFCAKLLLERQYTAACFLTTRFSPPKALDFHCPNEGLSCGAFFSSMLGHV